MAGTRAKEGVTVPLLLVLGLLLGSLLAGCISTPETEITVRRGDLIQAELAVWNTTEVVFPDLGPDAPPSCLPGSMPGGTPCKLPVRSYAVSEDRPATLPDGWEEAWPLPEGLLDVLVGIREGEEVHRSGVKVWGNRSQALLETHRLEAAIPRQAPSAEAYGRTWNATPGPGDQVTLQPTEDGDLGDRLEVPPWCRPEACLFTSRLVGWNGTHLQVEHQPVEGQRVHIEELDTWLTVADVGHGNVTIDNNHPLAGQRFEVTAQVEEIRVPPEGQRRAPSFTVTTLNGTEVSLSDHAGEPLILEFFASWCPSCRENTDHLSKLQATYGDRINILAIDVDPWEEHPQLRAFIEANDVTWPIALDRSGEVSRAYGVGALSTEVVISPQGAIVHTETGVADHERVSRIVHDLLPPDHHDGDAEAEHP